MTAAILNARSKRRRAVVAPKAEAEAQPITQIPAEQPAPEEETVKLMPERPLPRRAEIAFSALEKQIEPEPVKPTEARQPPAQPTPKKLPAARLIDEPSAKRVPMRPPPIRLRPRALRELPTDGNGKAQIQEQQPAPPPVRELRPVPPVRMAPPVSIEMPRTQPVEPLKLQPAVVEPVEEINADEVEIPDEPKTRLRIHRGSKFTRFLMIELGLLVVLIPSAILAVSHYFKGPVLVYIMNGLTITAAVTAAIVPILFFAIAPTLPRIER